MGLLLQQDEGKCEYFLFILAVNDHSLDRDLEVFFSASSKEKVWPANGCQTHVPGNQSITDKTKSRI